MNISRTMNKQSIIGFYSGNSNVYLMLVTFCYAKGFNVLVYTTHAQFNVLQKFMLVLAHRNILTNAHENRKSKFSAPHGES